VHHTLGALSIEKYGISSDASSQTLKNGTSGYGIHTGFLTLCLKYK
jgi:hypothetical protein